MPTVSGSSADDDPAALPRLMTMMMMTIMTMMMMMMMMLVTLVGFGHATAADEPPVAHCQPVPVEPEPPADESTFRRR
jgi:hypothetical protein